MEVRINQAGVDALYRQVGENAAKIIQTTATETKDQNITLASDTLRTRLATVGFTVGNEWCRVALETLRRGDTFTLNLK